MMQRRTLMRWTFWSALFFGLAAACLGGLYYRSFPFPVDGLARLFIALALPGHFIFLSFLVSLLILPIVLMVPSRRVACVAQCVVFSHFMLIVIIDIKVFELYRKDILA